MSLTLKTNLEYPSVKVDRNTIKQAHNTTTTQQQHNSIRCEKKILEPFFESERKSASHVAIDWEKEREGRSFMTNLETVFQH